MAENEQTWTLQGLAYSQIAMTRDDLLDVATKIRAGARAEAVEKLNAAIRMLEAARNHLA